MFPSFTCFAAMRSLLLKSPISYVYTMSSKNMNLSYSIRMYWTNIWQSNVYVQWNMFKKNSYRSWYLTSLAFLWHLLRSNWSIIRGIVSLWKMFENGQIAVFEGKWGWFRILLKVQNSTVTRIIYQFEGQKKREDVRYQLL